MADVVPRTITIPPREGRAEARAHQLEANTRLGQYEVIRLIGAGGMGEVYLARDLQLARKVAIKVLHRSRNEHTDRFLAEARATAQCVHENIVVIHEVDEHDGAPYMVLEHLDGATLRQVMSGSSIAWGRAIELVLPIVRALVCAHERQIVHLDLKPENVFVTSHGSIKVLDFGIARLVESGADAGDAPTELAGTFPYMSPEQFGCDVIDHRSDLWAVGIILYELLAGKHPLGTLLAELYAEVTNLDAPMPALPADLDVPDQLRQIVARCLVKRRAERFTSARELLAAVEALQPDRRPLHETDAPYPGLASFEESDAARFFGRDQEIARVAARVRERPIVGIIGTSGIGKSSLVRAGVIPALRTGGESWQSVVLRPGRRPVSALAELISVDANRLEREPGVLGSMLRERAHRSNSRLLLFIDQFEELYTLGARESERKTFTACLAGIGDDAQSPLRIVIAMRSDFLDRAGEDAWFSEELGRGLIFVAPVGRTGLREALLGPISPRGYAFESNSIVDEMVDALSQTTGALPLLQFAASRLWDERDRERKLLPRSAHVAMGGITGAIAAYADRVTAELTPAVRRVARTVLPRFVTAERTRAVVTRTELRGLASEDEIDRLMDQLVAARLLVVVDGDGSRGAFELVHESLIAEWPTLRRWLEESHEMAAYLAQVRVAAKQWEDNGRAPGMLWRGDAVREARALLEQSNDRLADREREFLNAVCDLASRAVRIRRRIVVAAFAVIAAIAIASAIAFVMIRNAEQTAQVQARRAEREKQRAQDEATRARAAETTIKQQLDQLTTEQTARQTAESSARSNYEAARMSKEQLEVALEKAERERATAQLESQRARAAEEQAQAFAAAEKRAREEKEKLLVKERARNRELEERGREITNRLPK